VVTSSALKNLPFTPHRHKIDIIGSTLLVAAVVSFILMISWGGESTYAWTSPPLVGMGVLSVVLATLFLFWETRAAEPILPLRLFRNPIFRVIVPLMVLLGSMMYGANAFLPLFLQAVNGVSATQSGLLMLPMMLGVTISSISSGRLTAITGRYKQWPIIGMGLVTAGTAILARMDATTSMLLLSLGMLLLGLGMGMTMPTSTLAVQNSVEFRDMGVGTSMVTFFRSLGGAIGLAAYGAVFNAQIVSSGINQALLQAPDKIHELPPADQAPLINALSSAVAAIFLVALPVMVIGWVLTFFLKEIPLRETTALDDMAVETEAEAEAGAIAPNAAIAH
jgi:MFS family permease